MEMAMKLLERDVHEKQDTIITLREQLDDIKHINLEMYTKLQVSITTPVLYLSLIMVMCVKMVLTLVLLSQHLCCIVMSGV